MMDADMPSQLAGPGVGTELEPPIHWQYPWAQGLGMDARGQKKSIDGRLGGVWREAWSLLCAAAQRELHAASCVR